jgi:hypothetical protein
MPSPVPPPGSNFITLNQFLEMKQIYNNNSQTILAPPFQNQNILVTSETFNVDVITTLAAVTGCAGLRIYYGMDADLKVHAMLIAVDANGNDILPTNPSVKFVPGSPDSGGAPAIGEEAQRCPPTC